MVAIVDSRSGAEQATAERYEAITLKNFESVPQIRALPAEFRRDIDVVGRVLPFKSNRFVVEHLIDWSRVPDDPIYRLTFPQRDMLEPAHYDRISHLLATGASMAELKAAAGEIRLRLNPHPAGQMEHNVPVSTAGRCPACSTSTGRRCCSSSARGRPVTPTARSVFAGRSSWAWTASSSP